MGAGLLNAGLLMVFPAQKGSAPPPMPMKPASQAIMEQTPAASPVPATNPAPANSTAVAVQEISASSAPEPSTPPAMATPTSLPSSPTPAVKPSVSTPDSPPALAAAAPPSPRRYFVNNDGLSIREAPDTSSTLIGTLDFKEEVELLETSGGWGKVRDVRRNIIGWSYMRYLDPVAGNEPRTVSQHPSSGSKKPESMTAQASEDM